MARRKYKDFTLLEKQRANEAQRIRRSRTNNIATRKYEKTFPGFIMRMYRNMNSRVLGIQKNKRHLYEGKPILDKYTFYSIARKSLRLKRMFSRWENSGYQRRLCPSIDRKNPLLGYTIDNIQFVEFYKNCSRITRRRKNEKDA